MLIAGVVVVALIAGAFVAIGLNGNKPGPGTSLLPASPSVAQTATEVPATPTPGPTIAEISFSPPTVTCDSPVLFTTTTHLPASVQSGDTVTVTFDGQKVGDVVVEDSGTMSQQPDGSWVDSSTTTVAKMQEICDANGTASDMGVLTPGTHTMTAVDADGVVLAEGSYVVIAPTATPSPKSSGVTFAPSKLSCSTPVDVTITIRLPASVHVGDTIGEKLDGKSISSGPITADAMTVHQPDGSWIVTDRSSAAGMKTVCKAGGINNGFAVYTPGTHTLQVVDADGVVLAEGSYTVAAPIATPSPKASGITFVPSVVDCSAPAGLTTTIHLPSSVHSGDIITEKFDGKSLGSETLTADSMTVLQPDGSWILTDKTTVARMQQVCAAGGISNGVGVGTPGTHTLQVLDANGVVLAEGSYKAK